MSRRPVSIWIHERLERARWLTLGGAVALIPATVVGGWVTWRILYAILNFLNVIALSVSDTAITLLSLVLLIAVFAWQLASTWQRSHHLGVAGSGASLAERMMIELGQLGSSYGAYMLRREALGWVIFLIVFFIGPQLLCLSVVMFRRVLALKRLDDETTVRILTTMMKGESRLSLDEIRERFAPPSMMELIGGLTALDGVVLVGADSDSPALTVAPRLTEDYKDWLAARREQADL